MTSYAVADTRTTWPVTVIPNGPFTLDRYHIGKYRVHARWYKGIRTDSQYFVRFSPLSGSTTMVPTPALASIAQNLVGPPSGVSAAEKHTMAGRLSSARP
ncbi:MAG: hypothetical protein WCI74_09575 [Actinomycetes bacterium]